MRIALVAPPFISVPPSHYGGTEFFIAQLAEGLQKQGFSVVVYANGESKVGVEVRWLYEKGEWPIKGELYSNLKDVNHSSWAVRDAWEDADIIHLNNAPALVFSRFRGPQFVYTIHHPHNDELSRFYSFYPEVDFVSISDFQRKKELMLRMHTIHHGVDMNSYGLQTDKKPYLSFLGRIAPMKGTHIAIEVAKRSGIPLKIAGEVQPIYREYFESQIKPHIDGKSIEYVGEADLAAKNELLGNSLAMLFPIQWDEPFGLVMIEAMATGTPVLAFRGGAVAEVVRDGVSGHICSNVDEMVQQARNLPGKFSPRTLREYVQTYFSTDRMVADYAELYRDVASNGALREEMADLSDDSEESQAIA